MPEDIQRKLRELGASIKVIGIGSAGANAVDRMSDLGVEGAELIALDTDAQKLDAVDADTKLLLRDMRGTGTGGRPEAGEEAALRDEKKIRELVMGSDLVFISCGLGGGTGSGAAPVVARISKELNALTVAVVTTSFDFEGEDRREYAAASLRKLEEIIDTLIVMEGERLLSSDQKLSLEDALHDLDELLMRTVEGLVELILNPELINLSFSDLRTVMKGGGVGVVGFGWARDPGRATAKSLRHPLLEVDLSNADSALLYLKGSFLVSEAKEAMREVHNRIHPESRIIWGAGVEEEMDEVRAMLIITGPKIPLPSP